MRLLGVDFGSKRIGIALGEPEHGVTTARKSLAASGTLQKDAEQIVNIAKAEKVDAIVVGVPENLPDKDQRMARICLQLAERIRETGWTVHTVNEAYTSIESEKTLSSVYKPNAVRKMLDGEAARLILEQYFNGEK